jgi:hypothetical protein
MPREDYEDPSIRIGYRFLNSHSGWVLFRASVRDPPPRREAPRDNLRPDRLSVAGHWMRERPGGDRPRLSDMWKGSSRIARREG